ncbi:MAG: PhzF family phenazine biosynthesis protein, partial [Rhodospirillaceae bacterium]|nr:PhzF family phenazine biosynthesis protein [Rhodospirillaceae bacterium]
MARYRYIVADVFTSHPFAGNPLAVITDGRGLSAGQMQAIAREFNLSETVFVLPPEDEAHFRRLRIFTPAAELPFAGHPTVGTACVLAALGQVPLADGAGRIVLEEGVGPIPVDVRACPGAAPWARFTLTREPEQVAAELSADRVAAMLSLEAGEVAGGRWFFGSAGMRFLYVELLEVRAVSRARPRREVWSEVLGGAWSSDIYLFARTPDAAAADLHARMFAYE